MNAGQLREQVTLLTPPTGTPDGQGGTLPGTGADTTLTVWARVQALNGTAQLALGAVATGQVYTVTIRTGPAVATGQRLTWNGRTLRTQSIAPAERRDLLLLTCFDDGRP